MLAWGIMIILGISGGQSAEKHNEFSLPPKTQSFTPSSFHHVDPLDHDMHRTLEAIPQGPRDFLMGRSVPRPITNDMVGEVSVSELVDKFEILFGKQPPLEVKQEESRIAGLIKQFEQTSSSVTAGHIQSEMKKVEKKLNGNDQKKWK